MNDRRIIAISCALVPILLAWFLLIVPILSQEPRNSFLVKSVVDGDTIVLVDGRHIRYLGINTPERGEALWEEAKEYNAQKVGGAQVTLEYGQVKEDTYGRTLAYVSSGGDMINAELLKASLAHLFVIEPIAYYQYFLRLQEEARTLGRGIWGRGGFRGPLKITRLKANAEGYDRYNLNGEYVRLCNISPVTLDLKGFSLTDQQGHHYTFSKGSLRPGYTALLFSGAGKDVVDEVDQLLLFWGSHDPIWNNEGDQASLRNPQGELIDTFEYKR